MPASEISIGKKIAAWSLAILAALAAGYAYLMFWMVVGALTHVIAMCSDAPHWWDVTYLWLSLLVLVPGYYAGRRTYQWFMQRERYKLHKKELQAEDEKDA